MRFDAKPPGHVETPRLSAVAAVAYWATDHALLWADWKELSAASNKPDADVVRLNRRMVDLQHKMDHALDQLKKAVKRANRKGKVGRGPVQDTGAATLGFGD